MNRMYRGRKTSGWRRSASTRPAKRDAALAMLKEHHVAAANYRRKAEDDDKFAEALDKEWPGPVPYTC